MLRTMHLLKDEKQEENLENSVSEAEDTVAKEEESEPEADELSDINMSINDEN